MGTIATEQRDRVLVAVLDNPPHGLFDRTLVDALEGLVARASADDAIGAVVLTGAHPERFLAHYDVGELLAGAQGSPAVGRRAAAATVRAAPALRRVPGIEGSQAAGVVALERFHRILLDMNRSGAVFVAALNGSAMGGGCELALACDVRLMAEGDHRMGQPEILFAFPPGGGGTQRLTRMLGAAKALRLILDGGPVSPVEAAELGIVDEVVPAGELLDRAVAVAARLGARDKRAIAACKRAVYEGGSLPLPAGLRVEQTEFLATAASDAAVTAMAAYQEQLERTGELPGYDAATLDAALERGRFGA
jgi:enoyl-CoA hydratase/carnithine racemase